MSPSIVACILFVSLAMVPQARADLRINQSEKSQVISIAGLYDANEGCHPFDVSGVVVKREFREDAVTLAAIVLEETDGKGNFIKVIAVPERFNMAARGNLIQGLQLLSRVGRTISATIYACGAAGRTFMQDAIR
jgi:hypothetical protein